MERTFLILLFFSLACNNLDMNKGVIKIDTSLIKGTWQYCDKYEGYKLMEITDTIYYYVDNGEYIGPYIPQGYVISRDTLAWTYEDGTMDKSNMW